MNTLERTFVEEWLQYKPKLREYFLIRRVHPDDVDDLVQDVAVKLWRWCRRRDSLPEKFEATSAKVARHVLIDAHNLAARRPKLEYVPDEYIASVAVPFADLWGNEVPGNRWTFAEEVSIAPLVPSQIMRQFQSLPPKDLQIVQYLYEGLTLQEISPLVDEHVAILRYRLREIRKRLLPKISPTDRRRFRLQTTQSKFWFGWRPSHPLPIQKPHAANYLRKLPGYVPEWVVWFSRLSAHINDTREPITFGIIQRLAQENGALNEEQGRRFLLAATSDKGALLSQKFFQLAPEGEPRLLSFSDIYQLLQTKVSNDEWMDQIATAWEPTSKWTELMSW